MSLFANQPPPTGAPFGLRQRRDIHTEKADENANPNDNAKWETKPKVRPPPRQFLATSGKYALRTTAVAPAAAAPTTAANSSQALVPITITQQPKTDESSLWVLAHGHRTPSHLRSLLRRLESCGTITSTRGSPQNNWIAVRYSSELAAHKAKCQDGEIISVAGSTLIIGVHGLVESDAQARLGIDIYNGEDAGLLRNYGGVVHNEQICVDDGEVLLNDKEEGEGESLRLDSVCGKVLAWFFNW